MRGSPFHPRTVQLCESFQWRNWAGYAIATKYELTHEREYYAIRNAAALLDITPLYKYLIQGPDAARFVDRLITRDVSRCRVGQVMYTTWCNEAGKVIDDGTVSRLDETTFRITAAEPNWRWFEACAFGLDVTIADISEKVAALALQGPNSRAILCEVVSGEEKERLERLKFFRVMSATIAGCPVSISRTGYTGDLGFEIWLDAKDALVIWDCLMEAGAGYGITPTGLLALDIARIEAGLLLIDVDYTPVRKALIPEQLSSPFELDLGWTVHLDKRANFVGKRALLAEHERGSRWATVGLEVDWDDLERAYARVGLTPQLPHEAWRGSVPLYERGRRQRQVGYATSGTFSPILKRYIALGTVEPALAGVGTELLLEVTIEHVPYRVLARVTKKPFFDPERKRK
ncbi:MAG: aminomethyl transferase family protein [Chloroflexi bacterium]|nr:MAG: aminomethyl transferase family protein [Chloroflexota bacterium]